MIFRFWKSAFCFALRLYGGGGGDDTAAQARDQELQRQGKVQAAVDAINKKFGQPVAAFDEQSYLAANPDVAAQVASGRFASGRQHYDMYGRNENRLGLGIDPESAANKTARDAQYTDIAGAVRDQALRDIDQQYSQASNKNVFGLARSGLLGGSVDAEAGADLKRRYGEGELKAEQAGLGAASDLRSQDEKTRQNLISLAQSGLDTGSADSMAASRMAAAADSAKANAATASVGRLFDDLSQAYVTNQVMRSRYGQPQQPSTGYSTPSLYGTKGYSGTVRN